MSIAIVAGDGENGTGDESVAYVICHFIGYAKWAKQHEIHRPQQTHAEGCSGGTSFSFVNSSVLRKFISLLQPFGRQVW